MTTPSKRLTAAPRLAVLARAVLVAATVTASAVITAPPAAAAETDYACEELTQLGNDTLGLNCAPRPGNPSMPVQLYYLGQNLPSYSCQSVTYLTADAILGSDCQRY
ncbi:hypothetical protein [Streptomyces sp. NPDC047841]|uniref:hypothetical protein n=1 Tax=Streptomyces sp. NPDC047841 TaxID=3154708 RepID=UPI0034529704